MRSDGATPKDSLVVLQDVCKNYVLGNHRVQALDSVNLQLHEKEFVILTGPSGSGKSSLLNIIGCLDRPTSGSVGIAGFDVSTLKERDLSRFRATTLGFIFQSFNLIPVFSAYENVDYPLRLQSLPAKERRERTMEMLEAVGLADHSRHRPGELSGGQCQRVAVARALVTHPRLVLADEPTANLDSHTGEHLIELMLAMRSRLATSFLIATHDPMVARHAGREWHLKDGHLS